MTKPATALLPCQSSMVAGDWAGRRVGLTGATGFVGYHLIRLLGRLGAQVTACVRQTSTLQFIADQDVRLVKAPLEDVDALTESFRGCEMVFHLAGAVDFRNDWQRFERVNVQGTLNVVAAARRAGVRRLIHTSSIVAVGASHRPVALDESAGWNLKSLRIPYITTKRRAEENALTANDRHLQVVVVNPGCVVGPEDFSRSEFGTLCKRFWRGRVPLHFGGGNNFVDVRDVAIGHIRAAEFGVPGQRYLLGGKNRTYAEFFRALALVAGRAYFRLRLPMAVASVVGWVNDRLSRSQDSRPYLTSAHARLLPLYFYVDSSCARRQLGYESRPLFESLADTHEFWIRRMGHADPKPALLAGQKGLRHRGYRLPGATPDPAITES